MTELNKEWYEGTLEKDKYYYAKDSSEGDCIVHINKSNEMTFTGWGVPYKPDQSNIIEPFKLRTELLTQVPSYEEWQAKREENAQLKEQINKCCLDAINRGTANTVKAVKEFDMPERIKELVEQNKQLKDLLEECSYYVGHSAASRMIKNSAGHKKDMKLLTKIDEALKCGNIK